MTLGALLGEVGGSFGLVFFINRFSPQGVSLPLESEDFSGKTSTKPFLGGLYLGFLYRAIIGAALMDS